MKNTRPLTVGQRVRYRAAWLRSVGAYCGPLPFARGTVTEIKEHAPGFVLATVEWNDPDIPEQVNIKNLEAVR